MSLFKVNGSDDLELVATPGCIVAHKTAGTIYRVVSVYETTPASSYYAAHLNVPVGYSIPIRLQMTPLATSKGRRYRRARNVIKYLHEIEIVDSIYYDNIYRRYVNSLVSIKLFSEETKKVDVTNRVFITIKSSEDIEKDIKNRIQEVTTTV